jgi:hypothetical protein
MKVAHSKTLITFAGLALVLPFVLVAAYVGTRAVGGAESSEQGLLLLCLALGGAFIGFAGGAGREQSDATREANALHITARERRTRKAHM